MDDAQFRMAITYALRRHHQPSGDVAVMWRGLDPIALQLAPAVDDTATNLALPVVRLLRTLETRPGKVTITTTAPPTEACLGMARMCVIKHIMYVQEGKLKKVTTERSGTTISDVVIGKSTIPDVTQMEGRSAVVVPWLTRPGMYGDALLAWIDRLARSLEACGATCRAAKGLRPLDRPPTTSFASSGLEYLGLVSMVGNQAVVDKVLMMIAWEMVAQVSGFETGIDGVVTAVADARVAALAGQNIGSLLADKDGNIVAWGFNTNKLNPTRHGEINLISSYLASEGAQPLPDGGTLYTTLEPCEMCSGAIHRTVRDGADFRVVYGQKDENVYSTALQRKVKPRITMEASAATMASALMINAGSAVGAVDTLTDRLKSAQDALIVGNQRFKATTAFLKEETTYKTFFAGARPQWWLYLWDYLSARLPPRTFATTPKSDDMKKELADPDIVKLNNQLDVIYSLVEQFMNTVVRQARG